MNRKMNNLVKGIVEVNYTYKKLAYVYANFLVNHIYM